MERIFYITLGASLCITGIWGIIREFIRASEKKSVKSQQTVIK